MDSRVTLVFNSELMYFCWEWHWGRGLSGTRSHLWRTCCSRYAGCSTAAGFQLVSTANKGKLRLIVGTVFWKWGPFGRVPPLPPPAAVSVLLGASGSVYQKAVLSINIAGTCFLFRVLGLLYFLAFNYIHEDLYEFFVFDAFFLNVFFNGLDVVVVFEWFGR